MQTHFLPPDFGGFAKPVTPGSTEHESWVDWAEMEPKNALLWAISYEIGTHKPVQHLINEGVSVEIVNELLENGVQGFSVLDRGLSEALRDCTFKTLTAAELSGEDVDTVIVVTESFSELFDGGSDASLSFKQVRNQTFDLFHELGIRRAAIFCVTYGGCMNLLQAAIMSKSLVQQGLSRNVLLVAAERCTSPKSRLMQGPVSIAGDGVAACLVSADVGGEDTAFKLDFISLAPYKNLKSGGNMASQVLEIFRAVKNAAADCYDARHMQPRDFRWVVLGDYNRNTSLSYAKLLGFPPERTFLQNVGRLGHIPFDPLINLADLARSQMVKRSDSVLMFLFGPVSCGAMSVSLA